MFFYFGRNAHHNGIGRNDLSLHDDGAGADDAIFSDLRPVEYRRMHTDDAIFTNRRAVNDRAVSDGNIVLDQRGKAEVDMHHYVILNITIFADCDRRHVGTDNGAKPDAAIFCNSNFPDQRSRVGNKYRIVNFRPLAVGETKRIKLIFQSMIPIIFVRLQAEIKQMAGSAMRTTFGLGLS